MRFGSSRPSPALKFDSLGVLALDFVDALRHARPSASDRPMLLALTTLPLTLLASSLSSAAFLPLTEPLTEPLKEPLSSPFVPLALDDRTFSYDYVEGGLSVGDATGFELGTSHEFEGPWIGVGRVLYLEDDESGVDVRFLSVSAGAGFVHALQEGIDLVATAELEYGDVDAKGFGDDSELGLRVLAGARWAATDELEVFGNLGFRTIFDDEFGVQIGGRYQFGDQWSTIARFDIEDDYTQFLIGARYGI
jgi:hypothetical protein